MTSIQRGIIFLGLALLAAATLGVVVRQRYRLWWSFALYLFSVTVSTALQAFWPDRFVTPAFWQAKETVYAFLRLAMAAEFGVRTLHGFPGAFAVARRLILLVLMVTIAAVALGPRGDYPAFVGEFLPRIVNGSAWTLLMLALVILWYRIPLHPFRKRILLSYIPYLMVATVVLHQFAVAQFQSEAIQYLNQLAYVALLAYWNFVIWFSERQLAGQSRLAA